MTFFIKNYYTLFFFYLFSISGAYGKITDPTEAQLKIIPPYCQAQLTRDPVQREKWKKKLGKGYTWINHYCSGLVQQMNCVKIISKQKRNSCLKETLSTYEYVFDNAPRDFALNPKLYYERGKIYSELGKTKLAEMDFIKSINLKPNTSSPYIELSKIYKSLNKINDAIAILQKGIKMSPNSQKLKNQLTKLKDAN